MTAGPTGAGLALRSIAFDDLPVLPYEHWRRTSPDGRLRGGPLFPAEAPDWVHMPVDNGTRWLRGPAEAPAGLDVPPLPGRFAFVGPAVHHFGHMVAEFLHRLWVLREQPGLTPLLVRATGRRGVPGFVAEYLDLIGAPAPVLVGTPCRVGHLVVGEPGRVIGAGASAAYGRLVGAMLPQALLSPSGQARRLAVLRGHLQTGRCIGEAWIEDVLAGQGYRVLRPENHSLAEQIAAVTGAEEIVFSEGSALHLLDLLPPVRARVAVLGRRPAMVVVRDCVAEKAPGFVVYRPPFIIGSMATENPRANALTFIDPSDALRFLHAEGFVSAPPATDFLHAPDLLEADVAAYARFWTRSPDVAAAFIAAALESCRTACPDPLLQATLLVPAAG